MGPIIRLDAIRSAEPAERPTTRKKKAPRHRPGDLFLRGPVPMAWLDAAGALPGRALHVGVALWFESGLHRLAAEVPLSVSRTAERFGTDRATISRALAALEQAGLVSVRRAPGRRPLVTILAVLPPADTLMKEEPP